MSVSINDIKLYLLIIISSLFVMPAACYCEESMNNQLAIQIHEDLNGIIYDIDSNSYKHSNISDLIQYLRDYIRDNGQESSITILIDENVPFSIILNIRKILWKIGFIRINYFIYNKNTQKLLEFKFSDRTLNFYGGKN